MNINLIQKITVSKANIISTSYVPLPTLIANYAKEFINELINLTMILNFVQKLLFRAKNVNYY